MGQLLSVRVWADLIKQLSLDSVSQFTAVAVPIRFLTCIETVLECHECTCHFVPRQWFCLFETKVVQEAKLT